MIIEEFMAPEPGKHIIRVAMTDHMLDYTKLDPKNFRYLSPEDIETIKQKAVEAAPKAYAEYLNKGGRFEGVVISASTDIHIVFVGEPEATDPNRWTFLVKTAMKKKGFHARPTDVLVKVSARRATYEGHPAFEIANGVFAVHGALQHKENFGGLLQEIVANDVPIHKAKMKIGDVYHLGSEDSEAEYMAEIDEVGRVFILDAFWGGGMFSEGVNRIEIG